MTGPEAAGISPAHAGNTSRKGVAAVAARDQPRTCGEYFDSGDKPVRAGGSAPHMRGIPPRPRPGGHRTRISPAHAGNTPGPLTPPGPSADQPRTCGEYFSPQRPSLRRWGSAPHMRGIRSGSDVPRLQPGISPAHAGNTEADPGYPQPGRDQPRTCGEYSPLGEGVAEKVGSAPHMRGIRQGASKASHPLRDQPRTCGEYRRGWLRRLSTEGSAPHMRGIRDRQCPHGFFSRISPAHAGNTPTP